MARLCVCVRAWRACVRACVLGGKGAGCLLEEFLVVVLMAMYLTGYSDYLTGFHEPLLPPYRCHTGFEK